MAEPRDGADRPTLVFVHGAWHGSWCWEDNFIGYFTDRGYECVAFDLPGHDRPGTKARLWNRMGAYVDALERTIERQSTPVVVIGHSMGGLITQRVLERRGLQGAVLMASVPKRGVVPATIRLFGTDPRAVLQSILTLSMWPAVRNLDAVRHAFFTDDTSAEVVERTAVRLQNESYIAYLSLLFRWPRPQKAVGTPVLVVSGGRDGVFVVDDQRLLADAYQATFKLFDDSGHNLMQDRYWPEVADACDEWISGLG